MIVPVSRPILGRNEGIDLPRGVLRGLVKEDEKARQTAAEVRQRALRLSSCIEGSDAEVRLGGDAPALAKEGSADDPMGIGVLISRAGRGAANS